MYAFIKREYDYAIRMCAYLAGKPQGKPIALRTLSQKLALSRAFASKIMFKLRNKGIIGTVQGKNGGVFLRANPRQLSFYDILEAMDFDSTLNECVHNPQICPLIPACKIHLFFVKQENELIKTLRAQKIIDFSFSDSELDATLFQTEDRKAG